MRVKFLTCCEVGDPSNSIARLTEEAEGPGLSGVTPAGEDTSSKETRKPGKGRLAEAEMMATSISGTSEGGPTATTGEGQRWEIARGGTRHRMSG